MNHLNVQITIVVILLFMSNINLYNIINKLLVIKFQIHTIMNFI